MNLTKLFDTQRKLDARIVEEKGLEGQDLLPQKVLALLTELGELSNEWRGFKFWSKNTNPNTDVCRVCNGTGRTQFTSKQHNFSFPEKDCGNCWGRGAKWSNPMLEEYVDNLHFILSIGIEIGADVGRVIEVYAIKNDTIIEQFIYLNRMATRLDLNAQLIRLDNHYLDVTRTHRDYERIFLGFIGLGEMLGFTWEQIEAAYYDKNKVNHARQGNGY